jgi:hypothetical protein
MNSLELRESFADGLKSLSAFPRIISPAAASILTPERRKIDIFANGRRVKSDRHPVILVLLSTIPLRASSDGVDPCL